MPFHMKLEIVRVECVVEQLNEVGKDEMRAIGWGVSRKGHFFSMGLRDLGSFGEGDVKPPGALPQTLFERDLEDDGLEVAFFLWLVEEDGGGVRKSAASLDQQFRAVFLEISQSMTGSGFPARLHSFAGALPHRAALHPQHRAGGDPRPQRHGVQPDPGLHAPGPHPRCRPSAGDHGAGDLPEDEEARHLLRRLPRDLPAYRGELPLVRLRRGSATALRPGAWRP